MIETYVFTETEVKYNVEASLRSIKDLPGCCMLWINLHEYTDQEIEDIAKEFAFHPVTVQSCIDSFRRPRLWEFDSYFYTNLTTVKNTTAAGHVLKPSELHVFAGSNYLITATREKESEAVTKAIDLFKTSPALCARGSLYAVYILIDDLVETYIPYVERLDSAADKTENLMLEDADKKHLGRLFGLKRRGQELRRLLGPQRDIFSELARRDFPFVSGDNRAYFQDSYNRVVRIFDMLDTIREVLSASLDIYLSSVSNRLNEIMKILTIISTIMMLLGFVTGFFGMNFTHLPWLTSPNAFRNITITMAAMVLVMLYVFRRIRWI